MLIDRDAIIKAIEKLAGVPYYAERMAGHVSDGSGLRAYVEELRRAIGNIPAAEAPAVTLPTEEEIARAMWDVGGRQYPLREATDLTRSAYHNEARAVLDLLRSRLGTATEPDAEPVKPAPVVDHAYSRALRIEVVRAIGSMLVKERSDTLWAYEVEKRVRALVSEASETEKRAEGASHGQ